MRECVFAGVRARSLARGPPSPAGGRAGVGGAHGPGAGDPAAAPAWGHPRGRAATRKKSLFGRGGGEGAVGFLGSGRAAGRGAGRCGPRERRLRGRGAWQPCGNAARRADAGAPLKTSDGFKGPISPALTDEGSRENNRGQLCGAGKRNRPVIRWRLQAAPRAGRQGGYGFPENWRGERGKGPGAAEYRYPP